MSQNYQYYFILVITYLDPRTANWLFMQSPWATLQLTAIYLLVVYFGPKYMKGREAINAKLLLVIYNLALVILNLYICLEVKSVS